MARQRNHRNPNLHFLTGKRSASAEPPPPPPSVPLPFPSKPATPMPLTSSTLTFMTLLLRASRVKPLPPATAAGDGFRFGELRQRSVNGRDSFVDLAVTAVGDGYVTETVESLELKRVLGNDSIRE